MTLEIEWRCPVAPDGPYFYYVTLPYNYANKRWEAVAGIGCSIPAAFNVYVVCGVQPNAPETCGPWWLNFDDDSTWNSHILDDTSTPNELNVTWQTPTTGPISDGGCCHLSPGGIAFVRLRGTM